MALGFDGEPAKIAYDDGYIYDMFNDDARVRCVAPIPPACSSQLSRRHVLVNSRGGRARHHHVNGMGGYGTTATTTTATTSISARGSREQATSSSHADVRTTFDDDVIGIRLEAGGRWLRAAVRCIDGSSTSNIDDSSTSNIDDSSTSNIDDSSRPTILMTRPLRCVG